MAERREPTPGPWEWKPSEELASTYPDFDGLYGPDSSLVVMGVWHNDSSAGCGIQNPADAQLIAAAPDLLEALTAVMEGFKSGYFVRNDSRDNETDWAIRAMPYLRSLAKAEAAILKAEGARPQP